MRRVGSWPPGWRMDGRACAWRVRLRNGWGGGEVVAQRCRCAQSAREELVGGVEARDDARASAP
eukprot:scaffold1758_cov101-Isochrysis_galbana.AAC.2